MGIGTSIILIAVGAVLAFAVTLDSTIGGTTVEWNTVGWILMAVGAIGLVMSLIWLNRARSSDVVTHDRVVDRDPMI